MEPVPGMSNPVDELREEIKKIRQDISVLRLETVGDRNQLEAYKATLRGRVEHLEGVAEKLHDYAQVVEIAKSNQVIVKRLVTALNWASGIFVGGLIAGLATFIFNRLTGGS